MNFLPLFLLISSISTCFSPDEECDQKLIKTISTAQRSIDVAIFDVNLPKLVEMLISKSERIPVRIILDKRQSKGLHSLSGKFFGALLTHHDLKVKYGRQRGIMHNKFIIIDARLLETGSFNYTWHASHANAENQIYVTQPSIVHSYLLDFELMWKKASESR